MEFIFRRTYYAIHARISKKINNCWWSCQSRKIRRSSGIWMVCYYSSCFRRSFSKTYAWSWKYSDSWWYRYASISNHSDWKPSRSFYMEFMAYGWFRKKMDQRRILFLRSDPLFWITKLLPWLSSRNRRCYDAGCTYGCSWIF